MTVSAVTPTSGLSSSAAAVRLREDGPNVLPSPNDPPWIRVLARQMSHFFAVMLWVAAGLALLAGTPQLAGAIVVVVVVNGVFAFVQEFRADRAGKRLRDLLPVQVTVIRNSRRQVVSASALVRGDLVVLEAGDRVSADVRLREVRSLAIDESMLTGESVPSRPEVGGSAWAGTFVVEGEALGLVQEIGAGTQLAAISQLADGARPPVSPLANQLHRVVGFVAILGIAAVLLTQCEHGISTECVNYWVYVWLGSNDSGSLRDRHVEDLAGTLHDVVHRESRFEGAGDLDGTFEVAGKVGHPLVQKCFIQVQMSLDEAWQYGAALRVQYSRSLVGQGACRPHERDLAVVDEDVPRLCVVDEVSVLHQ